MKQMKNKVTTNTYLLYSFLALLTCINVSYYLLIDDWYWHERCGEWISNNGLIHNVLFTWSAIDVPWVAHEWLFELFSYLVNSINQNASVWIYFITTLITLFLALKYGEIKANHNVLLYLMTVIQVYAYSASIVMRPQYIVSILLVLLIVILNNSYKNPKILYFIPIIQLFWVNFHMGTSVLLLLIYIVYFIVKCINWNVGKVIFHRAEKNWIINALVVFSLILVTSLINPYTIKGLTYAFENMRDQLMVNLIAEWYAPDAKNIFTLIVYMLPICVNIISMIAYEKEIKAEDIALYFMFILLYLRSMRFGSYVSLMGILLCSRYCISIIPKFLKPKEIRNSRKEKLNTKSNIGIAICMLIGCLFVTFHSTLSGIEELSVKDTGIRPSEKIMAAVEKDSPKRIFNTYESGGYLIYNNIPVFLYQSYEPFMKSGIIQDYLLISNIIPANDYAEYTDTIEKYKFDSFLIYNKSLLLKDYIESSQDYELVVSDAQYSYYHKIIK